MRAQFGQGFRQFGALRRRRNELEYPDRPDDEANAHEAIEAVDNAEEIITLLSDPAARSTRPVLICTVYVGPWCGAILLMPQ